jgi:hypothetical protein
VWVGRSPFPHGHRLTKGGPNQKGEQYEYTWNCAEVFPASQNRGRRHEAKNARVEVTKADASSKAVRDHAGCAMAVACKRKFHLDSVIISRSVAYLVKGSQARRFKLPVSVSREVVSFDRGAGFSPGEYELSKVEKSNRLGMNRDPARLNPNRHDLPPKTKRFRHLTTNVRHVLGGQDPDQ